MPKALLNITNSNLSAPTANLDEVGWITGQVLKNTDTNLFIGQGSNWAGDYKTLSPTTSTTLSIPNSNSVGQNSSAYILNSPTGTAVTIDLTQFDQGQTITLFNNAQVLSNFQTSTVPTPINIMEGEYLQLLVIPSVAIPGSNDVVILNDKRSLAESPISSFKDLVMEDAEINSRFNSRGWISVVSQITVGNTGSGATYAGVQYFTLFSILWNNAPTLPIFLSGSVSTRGANAVADWTAAKYLIPVPLNASLNHTLVQYSAGSTAGFTTPGVYLGANTNTLGTTNVPQISITYNGSSTITPTYNGGATATTTPDPAAGEYGPNPEPTNFLMHYPDSGGAYGASSGANSGTDYIVTFNTVVTLPSINSFTLPPINAIGQATPAAVNNIQPSYAVGRMMRAF